MRLFVTGGTGLVGSNVVATAIGRGIDVIAAQYGPEPTWGLRYLLEPLDVSDSEAVRSSIRRHRPDIVIHCASLLDQVFMFRNRAQAWQFMVEGTDALARACREVGARFVFVSSDWVFDGREPLVDEGSPPFPTSFYGLMKAVSEQRLAAMDGLDWAVGRPAGVYGYNLALPRQTRWEQGVGMGDLASHYVHCLLQNRPVRVWEGEINLAGNPTLASDLGEQLVGLAISDATGIFHLCGPEPIDRLELAHRCAEVFGGGAERIEIVPVPRDVAEAHAGIPLPHKIAMSAERSAKKLGLHPLGVTEGLRAFRGQVDERGLP